VANNNDFGVARWAFTSSFPGVQNQQMFTAFRALTESAKKLAEHPDNIIKLASGLASLSAPAAQQGRGISKNASSEAPTPISDEWETVIREGA
jgi:hypothetical protein